MQGIANAANSQAASLEETATFLDKLLQILESSETAIKMANFGNKVRSLIYAGQNLAK